MSSTTTLLIGATGQLGSELAPLLDNPATPSSQELDVTDHERVNAWLEANTPGQVINTSAFLRVDDCEDERKQAWAVNVDAVRNLALACDRIEATFVHVSTDYVFGGDTRRRAPYLESDVPAPLNMYGLSKLAGEHAAAAYCGETLIVRSAGLYGGSGSRRKGGNFVETMLRLASERDALRVVDDQRLTPTNTADLAKAIVAALERRARGVLHITNSGNCSWYEFAREIFRIRGISIQLDPIPSHEYPTRAVRPSYSVLANERLASLRVPTPRPWKDALKAYLEEKHRAG